MTIVVQGPQHLSSGPDYDKPGEDPLRRTIDTPQHRTGFATGKLNNALNIRTKFQLFDPDDPARYQLYAEVSSEYALTNHWAVRSSIAINLDQNFDEVTGKSLTRCC